jgi:hypothetical protein
MNEEGARKIRKVKFSKGRMCIEYSVQRPGMEAEDEYTVNCGEAPHRTFLAALDNLRGHVLEMCEMSLLPVPRTTVHGASFSYTENADGEEVLGAVITALIALNRSRSPLVINTPHKFAAPLNDADDPGFCLTEEAGESLESLIEETNEYLNGHRAQGRLNLGGEADSTGDVPPAKDAKTALANDRRALPGRRMVRKKASRPCSSSAGRSRA